MAEFDHFAKIDDDDPVLCLSCGCGMDWDGAPVSEMNVCKLCWADMSPASRVWLQLAVLSTEEGGIGLRELLAESRKELRTARDLLEPGSN